VFGGGPFAAVFNQQWHVTYQDGAGTIWDSWYDSATNRWNLQQINAGGLTNGPPGGGPFASIFNQQWHVTYADKFGTIWDSWYDGATTDGIYSGSTQAA